MSVVWACEYLLQDGPVPFPKGRQHGTLRSKSRCQLRQDAALGILLIVMPARRSDRLVAISQLEILLYEALRSLLLAAHIVYQHWSNGVEARMGAYSS